MEIEKDGWEWHQPSKQIGEEKTKQIFCLISKANSERWEGWQSPKMAGIIFSNNKRCISSLILIPDLFPIFSWSSFLFPDGSGQYPMNQQHCWPATQSTARSLGSAPATSKDDCLSLEKHFRVNDLVGFSQQCYTLVEIILILQKRIPTVREKETSTSLR